MSATLIGFYIHDIAGDFKQYEEYKTFHDYENLCYHGDEWSGNM